MTMGSHSDTTWQKCDGHLRRYSRVQDLFYFVVQEPVTVWRTDLYGVRVLSLPRKLLVSINSSALSFLSLRILGAVVLLDTHCRVVLVCDFFGRFERSVS